MSNELVQAATKLLCGADATDHAQRNALYYAICGNHPELLPTLLAAVDEKSRGMTSPSELKLTRVGQSPC